MILLEIKTNPELKFLFYSPTIVFNGSPFQLRCSTPNGDHKSPFTPFKKGVSICFWGAKSYLNKESPTLLLSIVSNQNPSQPIECLGIGIESDLMVPNNILNVPLHYSVQSGTPITKSTIVTISSKILFINDLNNVLVLNPIENLETSEILGSS
jgi:hypothetical protein